MGETIANEEFKEWMAIAKYEAEREKMLNERLDKDFDPSPTCPACGSQNTFKDSDGWVYCNCCGEVWEEKGEINERDKV